MKFSGLSTKCPLYTSSSLLTQFFLQLYQLWDCFDEDYEIEGFLESQEILL